MVYRNLCHYSLAGRLSLCFQLFATMVNAIKVIVIHKLSVRMASLLWKIAGVEALDG